MTNTITFPSITAAALWDHEIKGQLSDGQWESIRPHDHWKFWANLITQIGPEIGVESNRYCARNQYNILALMKDEVVRVRMLFIGRLGKVARNQSFIEAASWQAEKMPETLEAWEATAPEDRINIPEDVVRRYYESEYTVKELKSDLTAIKMAMSTAHKGW